MSALALRTPFDNTAQRRRAACFDRLHELVLMKREGMRLAVGWAVLPENICQLRRWRGHGRSALFLWWPALPGKAVERARCVCDCVG